MKLAAVGSNCVDFYNNIENGKAYIAKSDCHNQLCVHAQAIGKEGGVIVCLPNKVVVKVVAKEVDAIT